LQQEVVVPQEERQRIRKDGKRMFCSGEEMVQFEFDSSDPLQLVIAQLAEKCSGNFQSLFSFETIHMIADVQ
jgi:hypothetical protein